MKKILCVIGLGLLATTWAGTAQAQGWTKMRLKSDTGIRINLDVQKTARNTGNTKPTIAHVAAGYLNVRAANLGPNAKATARITSRMAYNGHETGVSKTVELHLKPSKSDQYGAHLSGKVPELSTGTSGYAGNHVYRQSIQLYLSRDGTKWEQVRDPVGQPGEFNVWLGL